MPTDPKATPNPSHPTGPESVAVTVNGNPATDPKAARELHGRIIAGAVYASALQRIAGMLPQPLTPSAMLFVEDLIERMAPRDPAEEMLVVQLALTHSRVLHLTDAANRQERLESIRTLHEYADRASNTYRRLMLALGEYRRPTAPATFTAIKQANIAGQQVVLNHENQNATNELGHEPCTRPAQPDDTGGVGCPAGIRPAGEAVDAIHRTPNG